MSPAVNEEASDGSRYDFYLREHEIDHIVYCNVPMPNLHLNLSPVKVHRVRLYGAAYLK